MRVNVNMAYTIKCEKCDSEKLVIGDEELLKYLAYHDKHTLKLIPTKIKTIGRF